MFEDLGVPPLGEYTVMMAHDFLALVRTRLNAEQAALSCARRAGPDARPSLGPDPALHGTRTQVLGCDFLFLIFVFAPAAVRSQLIRSVVVWSIIVCVGYSLSGLPVAKIALPVISLAFFAVAYYRCATRRAPWLLRLGAPCTRFALPDKRSQHARRCGFSDAARPPLGCAQDVPHGHRGCDFPFRALGHCLRRA